MHDDKQEDVGSAPAAPPVGRAAFAALLIERELMSRHDLARAEAHAGRERIELAEAVVLLGLLSEDECYASLAHAAGLTLVDLSKVEPSALALRLVPERLARRHAIIPLSVDNRTLTYATYHPFHPEIEPDLSFASGRRMQARVAPRAELLDALERWYPRPGHLTVLAEKLSAERPMLAGLEETQLQPSASAAITLCNHVVERAVALGASDVHIECGTEGTTVRYRICGVLEPVLSLPASVSQPIRNRFKVMAGADITVQHRPQDGAFRLKVDGRQVDVRFSTLPTIDGEKLVLRVIDSFSALKSLDRLGYDSETLGRFRHSLKRPDGLVLVTGPTGSGKTTALYAALGHLRDGRTNILTVEDPVERVVAGVTQVAVNPTAGNTFASVLRSLMRQDPNIIMVGEIRDEEVAQIVGQAACTGHLVLSTMHTLDSASAITRLANLGLEPYKIAESLSAVLAQRLVRALCPDCQRRHAGDNARWRGAQPRLTTAPVSAGAGCEHCNQTGYVGRLPVAELLVPTDDLRDAIVRGATANAIRAAMRGAGMPTMRDRALQLVAEGMTSIEEVHRVLGVGAEQAPVETRGGPRVLIADDDPVTRMLVRTLLERENFEVLEATNGREALDVTVNARPDLLLIDLNMPVVDGYEAIGTIRRDAAGASLPILVLTGEDGPGTESRVLALGADDYILKPFEPAVLLSRVNAVFRRLKVAAA